MGKRKKLEKNSKNDFSGNFDSLKFDITSEAKRGITATFLIALAVLAILGFFKKAGIVGIKLNYYSGITLGWAKLILPVFLILAGVVLFLRKQSLYYVSKITGLILILISFTAFLHWFFEPEQMQEAAKAGFGGGYIGYIASFLAVKYLSQAGAMVAIITLFLIGLILAFNFSIFTFLLKPSEKEDEKKEPNLIAKQGIASGEGGNDKKSEDKIIPEVKVDDKKNDNIGKIEFVEGPDKFSRESFQERKFKVKKIEKNFFVSKNFESADGGWKFPPLDLLEKTSGIAKGGDVKNNAEIIQKTLKHFGIDVEIGEIKTGPSVTQYSFRPAVGVKISKILALQNDIALALAAHPIRIEAPIPGKSLIGIEVPNKVPVVVRLRDILESDEFSMRKSNLTIALGEDVNGNFIFGNLDKMPHLMIAGATGTGKSVSINSILTTLLCQNSPKDLKFILIDPKRVELSLYNGIPHLLSEVIVENGKVVGALKWAVGEMERRYRLLQDASSRDISSYNEKIKNGKKRKFTDSETRQTVEENFEKLPYIVIIIDELADLMVSHGKEVEGAIVRIAQMARAVGIHLIVSTQRPSVEVITGLIKANITTRVAFQVATQIDSRTILDMGGAEKLLGNGDLLYLSSASPKPKRIQGIFVSESEVKRVVKFIKEQKVEEEIGEDITGAASNHSINHLEFDNVSDRNQEDEMYESAKEEVIRAGKASASLLQRRLRVGYARAARLLDILENNGVIGPSDGAKPREVYEASKEPNYENPADDQQKRDKWQF